jgi:ABC-type Mn2+/Zn2+ transport system ATPase subunit
MKLQTVTLTQPTTSELLFIGRELTLGYGHQVILQNFSFEVHSGHILGIVGPNGSGKTTLLRTMLGLLKPLRGTVERAPSLAISYMQQRERIDTILPITALEVVLMGRTSREPALRRIRAEDLDAARHALALVGGDSLKNHLYRNLSGGQQQRVLLARAISSDPDVLVLDEPTAGMDVASEAAVIEFLRELSQRRKVTILIVTHVLPTVLNLADYILLMGAHGVVYGTLENVLQERSLSELYGVPVHLGAVAGQRTLVVGRPGASNV